jgi:hypothetical protein
MHCFIAGMARLDSHPALEASGRMSKHGPVSRFSPQLGGKYAAQTCLHGLRQMIDITLKEKQMRKLTLHSLIVIASLATSPMALANGAGAGTSTRVAPVILSATADLDQSTLVISGHYFGSTAPTVRLANQVLEVQRVSTDEIVARLPADIRPATYRLTVTARHGARAITSDAFHATLF